MANDPWFKKVASLLPFDTATGSDADWRSLVGYADLTSSVSVELGSSLVITGAPVIGTVGGRQAMLLNGSSSIHFTLTAGLNYMHTIVFEVYVASTTASQSFLGAGPGSADDDLQLSGNSSAQWGWVEQNSPQPAVSGAMTVGWHTVAFVFDGASTTRLYIDGVRVSVGSASPQGSTINVIRLGSMSTNFAANGSAIRKFRAYRGVQKFTGASYVVADLGGSPVIDLIPNAPPWFEVGTPVLSDVQSKFGGYSALIPIGGGMSNSGRAFGTNDFVVEGWFYPTSFAQATTLFAQWSASLPYGWYLGAATDGYLTLYVSSSSDTKYDFTWSTAPLVLNVWQHVALVRRGSRLAVFLNGTVVAWAYSAGSLPTSRFALGTHSATLGADSFVGYVDDVRVTIGNARYPLTAADPLFDSVVFAQSFRSPGGAWLNAVYRSKSVAVVGNVASSPVTTPFGAAGYAAYFDGAGDKLTIQSHVDFYLGNTFTIEFWVRPDLIPTSGRACRVLLFGTNGFNTALVCEITPYGEFFIGVPYGGTVGARTAPVVSPATWIHVAFSVNAGVASIYVNGVFAEFSGSPKPITTQASSTGVTLTIGYDTAGTVDFNYKGFMADLRITKGVARYSAAFSPSVAYLPTLSGSFTPPAESSPIAATGVSGMVKESDGSPRSCKVFAYSHATGALLGSAISDPGTGAFYIAAPERCYCVCLDDDANARNAIVYDRLDPV